MNKLHSYLLGASLLFGASTAMAGNTLVPGNVMPESGSTIEVGTMISVQFDEEMHWANDYAYYDITFEKSTMGNVAPTDWSGVTLDWSDVQVTFRPDEWQLENCDYTLTIPAGTLVNNEGEGNALIELTYTYGSAGGGGEKVYVLKCTNNTDDLIAENGGLQNPFYFATADWDNVVTGTATPTFTVDGVAKTVDVGHFLSIGVVEVLDMPDVITEAGTYVIDLPEGAFEVDGVPTQALHLEWTLDGSTPGAGMLPEGIFTPADGSEVVVGSKVLLTYDRDVTGNFGNPAVMFYNVTKDAFAGIGELGFGNESYQVSFQFTPRDVEDGDEITCTVSEGYIWEMNNMNMINPGEEVTYIAKVVDTPEPGELTITLRSPEQEGPVEAPIFDFMFDVPEGTTIANPNGASLYNSGLDDYYQLTASMSSVLENVLVLDLMSPVSDPGSYELTLAAGMLANGAATNEEASYHFTIAGAPAGEFSAEVLATNPSYEQPLAMIAEGETLTVTLSNAEAIGHIIGRLDDMNAISVDEANIFALKDFESQGDGSYTWTNNAIDYVLYEGHTYRLTLDCYDLNDPNPNNVTLLGTLTVDFQGATTGGAVYSNVKPVSYSPEPGDFITPETNVVTFTFDAPVTFRSGFATYGGQGAPTTDVTAAKANDEGTAWDVTIPTSFVANNFGGLDVIASFVDADGHYVITPEETQYVYNYWDVAAGQYTQIALHYNCIAGGVTVDVDPAEGEVSRLYTFHMSYSKGIGWGAISPNAVELTNAATNQRVAMGYSVLTQAEAEGWSFDTDQVSTWLELTLNTEVTDNGEYILTIPWEALTLGTEMNADGYKGQTLRYTISGNAVDYTLTPAFVSPENGETVSELGFIQLGFNEAVAVNPAMAEGFISSRTGDQYAGVFEVSPIDNTMVNFKLDPGTQITEAGVYSLVIGRNVIGNQEWAESVMTAGKAMDETLYYWTLGGASGLAQVSACSITPEEMVSRVGLVTMTVEGAYAAADDAVAVLECPWNDDVEPVYAPLKSAVIGDVTYLVADFGNVELATREVYTLSFSDWAVEGVDAFSVEFIGNYGEMAFVPVYITAEGENVGGSSQAVPVGTSVNVAASAPDMNWDVEVYYNGELADFPGIAFGDNEEARPAYVSQMIPVGAEENDIKIRYTLNVEVVYDFTGSTEGVMAELGDVTVKVVDDTIVVEGVAEGDVITVYSVNAMCVAKTVATESGVVAVKGLNANAHYIVTVERENGQRAAAKVAL